MALKDELTAEALMKRAEKMKDEQDARAKAYAAIK